MRLTIPEPKRQAQLPPVLCVPSSFCLRCPIEERAAVCFFKRPRPEKP